MEDKILKAILAEETGKAQKISDSILEAINPIKSEELPHVALSLSNILNIVMKSMDEKQKKEFSILQHVIGTRDKVIRVNADAMDALRKFDNGGGNESWDIRYARIVALI